VSFFSRKERPRLRRVSPRRNFFVRSFLALYPRTTPCFSYFSSPPLLQAISPLFPFPLSAGPFLPFFRIPLFRAKAGRGGDCPFLQAVHNAPLSFFSGQERQCQLSFPLFWWFIIISGRDPLPSLPLLNQDSAGFPVLLTPSSNRKNGGLLFPSFFFFGRANRIFSFWSHRTHELPLHQPTPRLLSRSYCLKTCSTSPPPVNSTATPPFLFFLPLREASSSTPFSLDCPFSADRWHRKAPFSFPPARRATSSPSLFSSRLRKSGASFFKDLFSFSRHCAVRRTHFSLFFFVALEEVETLRFFPPLII